MAQTISLVFSIFSCDWMLPYVNLVYRSIQVRRLSIPGECLMPTLTATYVPYFCSVGRLNSTPKPAHCPNKVHHSRSAACGRRFIKPQRIQVGIGKRFDY